MREPTFNGAVHDKKAEQEHADCRGKRNKSSTQHHADTQTRSQSAAGLADIELEEVPEQKHQEKEEQQKHQHGEAGEDQCLSGCFRIQETDIGGVKPLQRAEQGEEQQYSASKQSNRPAPRIGRQWHGRIIERFKEPSRI